MKPGSRQVKPSLERNWMTSVPLWLSIGAIVLVVGVHWSQSGSSKPRESGGSAPSAAPAAPSNQGRGENAGDDTSAMPRPDWPEPMPVNPQPPPATADDEPQEPDEAAEAPPPPPASVPEDPDSEVAEQNQPAEQNQ